MQCGEVGSSEEMRRQFEAGSNGRKGFGRRANGKVEKRDVAAEISAVMALQQFPNKGYLHGFCPPSRMMSPVSSRIIE
jgi:hypothetical protein